MKQLIKQLVSLAYAHQDTRNIFDAFNYIDLFKAGKVTYNETVTYIERVS